LLVSPGQIVKKVEAMGLEPTNLLTASQALYQLSYAPGVPDHVISRPHEHLSTDVSFRPTRSSGHGSPTV
jgi:hypothetical protein